MLFITPVIFQLVNFNSDSQSGVHTSYNVNSTNKNNIDFSKPEN